MKITTTWHNAGPHTIYAKLEERLGHPPTHNELKAEVRRILAAEEAEAALDDFNYVGSRHHY